MEKRSLHYFGEICEQIKGEEKCKKFVMKRIFSKKTYYVLEKPDEFLYLLF